MNEVTKGRKKARKRRNERMVVCSKDRWKRKQNKGGGGIYQGTEAGINDGIKEEKTGSDKIQKV